MAVAVVATTLALTACEPKAPLPIATNVTQSPSVASREDILAHAEITYRNYLHAVQVISERRNSGYSILKPYLSKQAYAVEVESFNRQKARGIHTRGNARLVKFVAQDVSVRTGSATAYACVDLSAVRVLNRMNEDVTPKSRPDRQTSLASFATSGDKLLLEDNGTWSGDSVC